MRNKKGQEMSVATLVLIVIGVILLVLLVLGFTLGWQNLWDKINIFGGGSDIDAVVQACGIASTANLEASYCDDFKKVTIDGQTLQVNCQYSAVQDRLEKRLDCGLNAKDSAKKYCANIYGVTLSADGITISQNGVSGTNAANLMDDDDLYNGDTCLELLTGKQIVSEAEAELGLKTATDPTTKACRKDSECKGIAGKRNCVKAQGATPGTLGTCQ